MKKMLRTAINEIDDFFQFSASHLKLNVIILLGNIIEF